MHITEAEVEHIGWTLEGKGFTDSQIDSYFKHAGVKGMKWGVRRERRVERLATAGKKNSTGISKVRAATNLFPRAPVDLVKGRGVTGGAARRADRQRARNARVKSKSGEASVKDFLVYYGGTRFEDIVAPVRTSRVNKPNNPAQDKYAVTLYGASLAARVLSGGLV